jgi:hypothetical protein
MRLKLEFSSGSEQMLATAQEVVAKARDEQQLLDMAYAIWPKLRITRGFYRLHFLTQGEPARDYFLVELQAGDAPAKHTKDAKAA